MKIIIRKYNNSEDYEKVLELIETEGDEWKDYLNPKYKVNLEKSITYVAYVDKILCGYSRSISDFGFFIWVVDLLVNKKYRGNSIGKKLMESVLNDYPDKDVFVMSDVDEFYEKIGYQKEGSIFKVSLDHTNKRRCPR